MLIGILVIFTASISLAVAGALIASTQVSLAQNQKLSNAAFDMANGCLENALIQMDRGNFSGPAKLIDGGGSCTISITTLGATTYQVISKAEFMMPLFNQYVTKTIQAGVSVNNGVTSVTSQQEIY